MKVLVAIANFGNKNDAFRDILIKEYQSMDYDIDIVILSNIPKDLGPDIKVKVGLPTSDPWSLPFGHKQLFADNIENYDLFIYTEDDTLLTQKNIESFLEVTEYLPEHMIAGFLRYEENSDKKKFCSTMHSFYHWDPSSVCEYNNETFAFYTNEHGALFILTRNQLKKAINSGGFLVPPHEGKYDKLVSAATDPYTQCGMKKMICVSRIDDFLIHHLPDIYSESMGRSILNLLEYDQLKKMIVPINNYKNYENFNTVLFNPSTRLLTEYFDKIFHTKVNEQLISLIKEEYQTILSVGCVDCKNEKVLIEKGYSVTGIPVDNIIASLAKINRLEVLSPDFNLAFNQLQGRQFDCIIFDNVLQFIEYPVDTLINFKRFLSENGSILIKIPNYANISLIMKSKNKDSIFYKFKTKIHNFSTSGLNYINFNVLNIWLKPAGLCIDRRKNLYSPRLYKINKLFFNFFNRYLSSEIIVRVIIKK